MFGVSSLESDIILHWRWAVEPSSTWTLRAGARNITDCKKYGVIWFFKGKIIEYHSFSNNQIKNMYLIKLCVAVLLMNSCCWKLKPQILRSCHKLASNNTTTGGNKSKSEFYNCQCQCAYSLGQTEVNHLKYTWPVRFFWPQMLAVTWLNYKIGK